MRGWWTPVLLAWSLRCSDDETRPRHAPDVPAPRQHHARRGGRPHLDRQRLHPTPSPSRTTASTAPATTSIPSLAAPPSARGNHDRAGVPGRRAGQRRSALFRGQRRSAWTDSRASGRRSRRYPAARRAERGAVSPASRRPPAAASASGTTSTATARCRALSWASCAGRVARRRLLGRAGCRRPLFLTPVRAGTGVEFYGENNRSGTSPHRLRCRQTYCTARIEALPGLGYVFETDGGDGFERFGALRVTHVGRTSDLDWAFQTDPGNPELMVTRSGEEAVRWRYAEVE